MELGISGIEKNNIINIMRSLGYISRERSGEEFSFIRPFGRSGYPRFHIFIRFDRGKKAIFNLHLDQKKPIYSGSRAHSAEYDGFLVEEEMDRIKKHISS
ncbi:MAG: hypothetical protein LRZ94_00360 [Candidatus Pacebacteria bacterium]|nr:hypothetical protein [Candidatus Paceibacterota bacterium]